MKEYLRQLPAIHSLQKKQQFQEFKEVYQISEEELTRLMQNQLDQLRNDLLASQLEGLTTINKETLSQLLFQRLKGHLQTYEKYQMRQVINATGTILHTNLGRAKLSDAAIEQVVKAAKHYSNLEFNIEEGKRGSRHDIVENIIKEITGAEAAMVVNNNAASVYLILRALAKGKEVIVSRGQLVEIGGSFRVSSIMEESGAHLVEIGTTNKTHFYDYESAINEETAMILKVHTSNFKTVGFTASVETPKLVELKNQHKHVIFYEDLGSGALFDFKKHGIGDEPVVSEVLRQGVDVISFSGDKLLGGPQAGIIVGKKDIIAKLKKHQLARVLRVDKMTLAGLEATLTQYKDENSLKQNVPTIRDITKTKDQVKVQAEKFVDFMKDTISYNVKLIEETSQIGGGTMPTVEIPTYAVAIVSNDYSATVLSEKLRLSQPAIVTRKKDDKVIFDFRTIEEAEIKIILEALKRIEEKSTVTSD